MALSQSFKDGFGDGWSDERDGRDTGLVIQDHESRRGDYYRTQYAHGYREGVQAYTQRGVR